MAKSVVAFHRARKADLGMSVQEYRLLRSQLSSADLGVLNQARTSLEKASGVVRGAIKGIQDGLDRKTVRQLLRDLGGAYMLLRQLEDESRFKAWNG